ncbi:unnamed protein product [Nesidiocoris tenuis]|uniref:Uncharacterized protein n=1 Tax=Nesidiocoris tenuis TaxID=355587 RepID=A0A6H5GV46_9HEMI|nr:unnamed protein product [Nesidiocoris tenuis]
MEVKFPCFRRITHLSTAADFRIASDSSDSPFTRCTPTPPVPTQYFCLTHPLTICFPCAPRDAVSPSGNRQLIVRQVSSTSGSDRVSRRISQNRIAGFQSEPSPKENLTGINSKISTYSGRWNEDFKTMNAEIGSSLWPGKNQCCSWSSMMSFIFSSIMSLRLSLSLSLSSIMSFRLSTSSIMSRWISGMEIIGDPATPGCDLSPLVSSRKAAFAPEEKRRSEECWNTSREELFTEFDTQFNAIIEENVLGFESSEPPG